MSTSRYRGFTVVARPYQILASRRWTADLEVRRDGRSQSFGIEARYPTELDADAGSISVGREIIDGRLAGISVEHMRREPRADSILTGWKGEFVRAFILAGIVVLGLGAFVLLRGASVTTQRDVLSVGDLQVTADRRQVVPPWVGVVALVVGAGLIVTGVRRKA